jgi:hypothetical protein
MFKNAILPLVYIANLQAGVASLHATVLLKKTTFRGPTGLKTNIPRKNAIVMALRVIQTKCVMTTVF